MVVSDIRLTSTHFYSMHCITSICCSFVVSRAYLYGIWVKAGNIFDNEYFVQSNIQKCQIFCCVQLLTWYFWCNAIILDVNRKMFGIVIFYGKFLKRMALIELKNTLARNKPKYKFKMSFWEYFIWKEVKIGIFHCWNCNFWRALKLIAWMECGVVEQWCRIWASPRW